VIERDEVIAPRFSSYLTTEGISAKLPRRTYKPRNETEVAARREFERRQARVQRLLRTKYGVRTFGFHLIPDAVWDAVPEFVIDHLPVRNLQQVRSYVRDDNVRGAVMRHVLDHLPTYGDVLLIAHSLGSIVAIDLLDRLPVDLHVRRFITIGSPGNIRTMHDGSQRLLKKFPYERVDDWSNIVNVRDVVTGGRGLANTFPGAQDFLLVIHGHDAGSYLGDVAVSGLVADALYPPEEVTVPPGAEIAVRMSEAEASALLLQHFAEAVARHIKDDDRAERYRAACKILRDELAAQLGHQATAGQLFAPAMQALIAGRLPGLPHRWELHEVVGDLVVMALTNCVTPYEIDPGDAPIAALEDIAEQLGFRRHIGTTVANAIVDVATCVTGKDRVRWGRVLTASTGLALLTAGPVGLAFAASAGAFGAAAISGRLAASGPDSLVAGLATLGGWPRRVRPPPRRASQADRNPIRARTWRS